MNVTWTICENGSSRPAQVHYAPRESTARGGMALACSRRAPTTAEAEVRETDAAITCKTCLAEYQRKNGRR